MPSAIKDDPSEDLKGLVASSQQHFQEALRGSADLLSKALSAHMSIYDQMSKQVPEQLPPNITNSPAGFLRSTSADVDKVYRQAKEMFDQIERTSGPALGGLPVPPASLPGPDTPPGPVPEDPLAASALLMTQATQHLNSAMESVLQAMDQRLSGLLEGKGVSPPGRSKKTRK
jgi:hypothetical protein